MKRVFFLFFLVVFFALQEVRASFGGFIRDLGDVVKDVGGVVGGAVCSITPLCDVEVEVKGGVKGEVELGPKAHEAVIRLTKVLEDGFGTIEKLGGTAEKITREITATLLTGMKEVDSLLEGRIDQLEEGVIRVVKEFYGDTLGFLKDLQCEVLRPATEESLNYIVRLPSVFFGGELGLDVRDHEERIQYLRSISYQGRRDILLSLLRPLNDFESLVERQGNKHLDELSLNGKMKYIFEKLLAYYKGLNDLAKEEMVCRKGSEDVFTDIYVDQYIFPAERKIFLWDWYINKRDFSYEGSCLSLYECVVQDAAVVKEAHRRDLIDLRREYEESMRETMGELSVYETEWKNLFSNYSFMEAVLLEEGSRSRVSQQEKGLELRLTGFLDLNNREVFCEDLKNSYEQGLVLYPNDKESLERFRHLAREYDPNVSLEIGQIEPFFIGESEAQSLEERAFLYQKSLYLSRLCQAHISLVALEESYKRMEEKSKKCSRDSLECAEEVLSYMHLLKEHMQPLFVSIQRELYDLSLSQLKADTRNYNAFLLETLSLSLFHQWKTRREVMLAHLSSDEYQDLEERVSFLAYQIGGESLAQDLIQFASIHFLFREAFIPVSPGSFVMGSPSSEPNRESDEGRHLVILTKDFEMQRTEVTQAQWYAVMGGNPSRFNSSCFEHRVVGGVKLCMNHPVEQVSWNDVQGFLARLNEMGEDGYEYRLPTEAEWEYVARAGTNTAYSFGNDASELAHYGWYDQISAGQTHPVATLLPNFWGFYDMHGNVWEWVEDTYSEHPSGPVTDPLVTGGSHRVERGGGWSSGEQVLRSAFRYYYSPVARYSYLGFRLLRTKR